MDMARRKPSKLKAVEYLRASTDKQDLSPDVQRTANRRWAKAAGVEIVATYDDIDVSGATPLDERPGLMEALEALKVQGAGVFLAADRERLGRDMVVVLMLERAVEDMGAVVRTADGASDGDSPDAILLRRVRDAFSEFERFKIKLRTKAALAVKRAQGRVYGEVPLGYTRDGDLLVRAEDEQETLARVSELARQGWSLRQIAAQLSAEGRRTKRGGKWAAETVSLLLRRMERDAA
jgi:DNA invertase Pin-like site-specific DNA recombinase